MSSKPASNQKAAKAAATPAPASAPPTSRPTPSSSTTTASAAAATASSSAAAAPNQARNYRLPAESTMKHATKIAIVDDYPIMMDYWTASLDGKCFIGVKAGDEKMLVKSEDEYTSCVQKFYKTGSEYIIITENSIYIVSSEIATRRISI